MTASLCGYDGSITGSGATEIFYWEISVTKDAVEATSFDSVGWKERIACLTGATGTFRAYTTSTVGAHATVTFKTQSVGGSVIVGNIIINRIREEVPVEGAVTFEHSFVFTGSITATGLI